MGYVCFYFQVHQPFRLNREYHFLSIGSDTPYEDESENRRIIQQAAHNCYLPANRILLELVRRYNGKFKISFCISGTALEQLECYAPDALAGFKALADTGCAEFLCETYYHSLSYLYNKAEYRTQVSLHKKTIQRIFGNVPAVLRNTELIYDNNLAGEAESLGFNILLAEGVEKILSGRTPNVLYRAKNNTNITLLLKNSGLSDDLAFRFSDTKWSEFPLTPRKYAEKIHLQGEGAGIVNLFMDYETFGEHQRRQSGIFDMLRALPDEIFRFNDMSFITPSEAAALLRPADVFNAEEPVSWADEARDTSPWRGNHLQDSALEFIYQLREKAEQTRNDDLIAQWRRLQTSDHFYYMCEKGSLDGVVHSYFSPFRSPLDAYVVYCNVLNDFHEKIKKLK